MMTLAQSDASQIAPPSPLVHYTLESPYLLAGVLVVASILVLLIANRSGKLRKALTPTLVLLVVAALVVGVARSVDTTREQVIARTGGLVDAVVALDYGAIEDVLATDVELRTKDGFARLKRGSIMDSIRLIETMDGIASHRIRELDADGQGAEARSYLHIVVTPEQTGVPTPTEWLITWGRGDDGVWRITEMLWLSYRGKEPGLGMLRGG
jgi:hypothetical protein